MTRLGHNADQHVRKPTVVESLRGKKIVHVAVGALHCLAVTEGGQGWNSWSGFNGINLESSASCHSHSHLPMGFLHRLKMELDLQSLFRLLCTAVLIGWDPPPLPSPRIWAHRQGALLVSQDRQHLFVTPCSSPSWNSLAFEFSTTTAEQLWCGVKCLLCPVQIPRCWN